MKVISVKSLLCGASVIKGLLVVFVMFFSLWFASPAYAICCPENTLHAGESRPSIAQCNIQDDDFLSHVNTIINVITGIIGLVSVIVIIVGGYLYATSAGDAAKLKKAKDTILYSVIGLVVALLAFAIVNFVLKNVFSGSSSGNTTDNSESPDTGSSVVESCGGGGNNDTTGGASEGNGDGEAGSSGTSGLGGTTLVTGSEPDAPEVGLPPSGSEVWIDEQSEE